MDNMVGSPADKTKEGASWWVELLAQQASDNCQFWQSHHWFDASLDASLVEAKLGQLRFEQVISGASSHVEPELEQTCSAFFLAICHHHIAAVVAATGGGCNYWQ